MKRAGNLTAAGHPKQYLYKMIIDCNQEGLYVTLTDVILG